MVGMLDLRDTILPLVIGGVSMIERLHKHKCCPPRLKLFTKIVPCLRVM
ncbi:hypothetical protein SAMN05428978_1002150 [Nitrosomonas sp. Nm34]|nr:hypothetical protein SAMN05428978_1002150 [Nitrosomonas sp. Nm34]